MALRPRPAPRRPGALTASRRLDLRVWSVFGGIVGGLLLTGASSVVLENHPAPRLARFVWTPARDIVLDGPIIECEEPRIVLRTNCAYVARGTGPLPALGWLARNQAGDGRWAAARSEFDTRVTALALLCYLERGHSPRSGPYRLHVRRGIDYLKSVQDIRGRFGEIRSGRALVDHAIASLALIRAYDLTGSRVLRSRAQRAIDFVMASRTPGRGWTYGVAAGDCDTLTTVWMVAAAKAATLSELRVDRAAFKEVREWFDTMTCRMTGRAGHRVPGGIGRRAGRLRSEFQSPTGVATAAALYGRIVAGADPSRVAALERSLGLLHAARERDTGTDLTLRLFGTYGVFLVGGEHWRRWKPELARAAQAQCRDRKSPDYGSWDPDGVRGGAGGGRVYATATNSLTLAVYHRLGRVISCR